MNSTIFALAGYLKKPKQTFAKRVFGKVKLLKRSKTTADLTKSDELEFMTNLSCQQEDEIKKLKREVEALTEQYERANRHIYQQNAPKCKVLRRKSLVRSQTVRTEKNKFSIVL